MKPTLGQRLLAKTKALSPWGTMHWLVDTVTVSTVDNPMISWSPYTWFDEDPLTRVSPAVGAYLDVAWQGGPIGLRLAAPVSTGSAPAAVLVSAQIDGGSPVRKSVAEADHAGVLKWDGTPEGSHTVRFTLAQNAPLTGRWFGAPVRALRITGIASGTPLRSLVGTPLETPKIRSIFYGDSITEGNFVGDTYGDESFAVVALRNLGHHFGLKGYTAMQWRYSVISETADFFYPTDDPHATTAVWRNAHAGRTLLTDYATPSFLDGTPDVVFNNVGTNDTSRALTATKDAPPSAEYLPGAVSGWLEQIRAATSPRTVVVMVMPVVYGCPEAAAPLPPEAIAATRRAYLDGIGDYRTQHPDDDRVLTVDLGDEGRAIHLAHPRESIHPGPEGASLIGELVAERVRPDLDRLLNS